MLCTARRLDRGALGQDGGREPGGGRAEPSAAAGGVASPTAKSDFHVIHRPFVLLVNADLLSDRFLCARRCSRAGDARARRKTRADGWTDGRRTDGQINGWVDGQTGG